MTHSARVRRLPRGFNSCFNALALALCFAASCGSGNAQNDRRIPVKGYITAVQSPDRFDVNNLHVAILPSTGFALIGENKLRNKSPLQNALQVGAYVEVTGNFDKLTRTTTAKAIYLRDDWGKKISGIGVIAKVLSSGESPVFCADGYQIRITPATDLSFADQLNSLADIGTNIWVRFEGMRDEDGTIIASRATFLPAKSARVIHLFGGADDPARGLLPGSARHLRDPAQNPDGTAFRPAINPLTGNRLDFEKTLDPDGNLTEEAGIRWGTLGGWHSIPADRALQERVRRIGTRLIPAYQKALAPDNPSRIHFRFYAMQDEPFRSEICPQEGIILIPRSVVERLKNDDQLAAVLADGVAYNLQRQASRVNADNRVLLGAYAAGDIAGAFIPGLNLLVLGEGISAAGKINTALAEERARVALALLADADYDPRQAPEAWRLLASKHAPKDPEALPYGFISGYQLSILNIQYRKDKASTGSAMH